MRTNKCALACGCLGTVLVIAALLTGCSIKETEEALAELPPSPMLLPLVQSTVQPTVNPTAQSTPTPFVLEPLFDSDLDLRAGPIEVPIELQIPSLKVNAPVLGVGLTLENAMDAPRGQIGNPIWNTAFWYRGSGIPGEPGTATIAGHVNDPLARDMIFARLQDLQPGDLIIIHYITSNIDIRYNVDHVKVYSIQESSDPVVLEQIFGLGPPLDDLSHLTLITCSGNIVNGQFDHHTVVYATRSD